MRTRKILLLLILILPLVRLIAQEETGTVSGRIYTNFNVNISNTGHPTAFELTRAYLGYERSLSDYLSAQVKLDVGSPDDISEFSRLRRYAYFKNAGVTYRRGSIVIWGGLFDMVQFKEQEEQWGYRYLYRSFLDEYRYGPSADLGAGVRYSFAPGIEADVVLSNGEGHSSPQRDDTYKTGYGITCRPSDHFTFRGYYSVFLRETPQMTFTGFAGYRSEMLRFAAEYNHQLNYNFYPGHNRFGYSFYGTWKFSSQWEIFARYDHLFSNITGTSEIPWNLPNDGSALIGGLQYAPVSYLRMAIDYQDWVEYAGNGEADRVLFLHLEVLF